MVPQRLLRSKLNVEKRAFNSSIDRDWTDMPVKPFFLPLMQQLCKYLSGNISEEIQNEIMVKQLAVSCPYDVNNIEITNPEGRKSILQPQLINNEKLFLYNETNIPGVYAITVNGSHITTLLFSVNVDTIESNLDKIDRKEITALMGGINLNITTHLSEKDMK